VFGPNAVVNANIMQGVVTGIGFIGAGAIIRQGDATTGHATAASIGPSASWVLRSAMGITTLESF
jgi:putative Mg2+ transporter-C (MgtC) family protein